MKTQGGVRFAPSPTGKFHLGNFRTAWISHWWAKQLGMRWVVRYEDIDAPRLLEGAIEDQQNEMESLGLKANAIYLQSTNRQRHWELFLRAVKERRVYPCYCSRKEIRDALENAASAPHQPSSNAQYNGKCRSLRQVLKTDLPTIAWRFRADDDTGTQDFIVARTLPLPLKPGDEQVDLAGSFVPAYNWACAIDDYDGDFQLIVRAHDLKNVVEQQRWIQRMVGIWEGPLRVPAVFHASLVTTDTGARLEKRTNGVTLPEILAGGYTPEQVVQKIQQSFTVDVAEFKVQAVFGERADSISLGKLGFPGLG